MHAEPHEDVEISSRKMDNIGFIQNVEAYNAFISEHGIEPDNSTNKNCRNGTILYASLIE